jgi:murein DD-endopeptidase MepM/ murein hydrolase activator NlpD
MKGCAARRVAILLAVSVSAACAGRNAGSPRDGYVRDLRAAGLDAAALGRAWIRAGEDALVNATATHLPLRETGYLPPERPGAVGYTLNLRRGRRLSVDVTLVSAQPGRLFVDLFAEPAPNAEPRRVASLSPDVTTLDYDVELDGVYLLRIQPELGRGGRYTVVERTLASLRFPLAGYSATAVRSSFGSARDGGTREHEGVDIVAPRGTPALAVRDGIASPGTNALGGNVVWLDDSRSDYTFYYAHLDRWAQDRPTQVRAGDVVGYVGNTGNARATAPHLHFGIYDDGAIDPLPFLEPDDPIPSASTTPDALLGAWIRVTAARTTLRRGAHGGASTLRQLERDWVARVVGASGGSLRVTLPDGSVGFLDTGAVTSAERPLRFQPLRAGAQVHAQPSAASPIVHVVTDVIRADVLGRFGDFDLVRLALPFSLGWIVRAGGGG